MSYETTAFGYPEPDKLKPVGDVGPKGDKGKQGPKGPQGVKGRSEVKRLMPSSIDDFNSSQSYTKASTFLLLTLSASTNDTKPGKVNTVSLGFPASDVSWWRACNAGPGVIDNIQLVDNGNNTCQFVGTYHEVQGNTSPIYTSAYIEVIVKGG